MGVKRAVGPSGKLDVTLTALFGERGDPTMVEFSAAVIIVLLALVIARLIWQR